LQLTSSKDIKTKITPEVLQSSIFTLEDLMNVHYDLNIPEDNNSTTEANVCACGSKLPAL
jgi:hypothetical protein